MPHLLLLLLAATIRRLMCSLENLLSARPPPSPVLRGYLERTVFLVSRCVGVATVPTVPTRSASGRRGGVGAG
eukprot:COSAG06_NODE_57160_length_281_cov_0.961538_1_plen_72_part_01